MYKKVNKNRRNFISYSANPVEARLGLHDKNIPLKSDYFA